MQSSAQNEKWFQVSLRFQGDALPVDEVGGRLNIEPSAIGRLGEHINGNPKYAIYPTNLWVWAMTHDSTISFEEQIGALLELLEPKKQALTEILSLPHVEGEIFLGFSSSNGQGGTYLSSSLLSRVGALGLALNLDLYPPSN